MTIRPLSGGLVAASTLAILFLSGCSATAPAEAEPAAVPTASTTPTPDAPAEPAPTCDEVFTDAEYASFAEDGLTLNTDSTFDLGAAMTDLAADGALTCQWSKPSSDAAVWFARLSEDDTAWAGRSGQLTTAGWNVSDDPTTGTMLAPADYDANYQPSMYHADGVTYFVSYAGLLGSVAELQ